MSNTKASLDKISKLFSEDILLQIVRKAAKNSTATISSYEVTYATAPGEGYLGIVYRIAVNATVDGKSEKFSMIAKGMPNNLARRKTWKIPSFFKNEVLFYGHILPILVDFDKRKRGEKAQQELSYMPVPECLWSHSDGDNDFIVMSDICVDGFTPSERTEGANQAHCEVALKLFGRFHGLGLALKNQEPELFKKMTADMVEPYFRLDYESWYSGFLKNIQTVAMDAISREYPNTIYETKMKEFANETQYKAMCELVKPVEPYAVPGHGDAWGPNFLYRYVGQDKSNPVDVRFLDFQLVRLGSPVLDLLFYLYSVSTTEQRRDGGYERLLRTYHDALSDAISSLGSDPDQIFSYDAFKQEMKTHGKFGLGMGIESVPLSMMSSDEVYDLETIPGEDEVPLETFWKVPLIESKEGRLRVADLIKFSVDQGYI